MEEKKLIILKQAYNFLGNCPYSFLEKKIKLFEINHEFKISYFVSNEQVIRNRYKNMNYDFGSCYFAVKNDAELMVWTGSNKIINDEDNILSFLVQERSDYV